MRTVPADDADLRAVVRRNVFRVRRIRGSASLLIDDRLPACILGVGIQGESGTRLASMRLVTLDLRSPYRSLLRNGKDDRCRQRQRMLPDVALFAGMVARRDCGARRKLIWHPANAIDARDRPYLKRTFSRSGLADTDRPLSAADSIGGCNT